jgi:WD40 repeat protein
LTAGADRLVQLGETATGQSVGVTLQHRHEVVAAEFSPDGRLVLTGGYDPSAQLWDAACGKRLGCPFPQPGGVFAVAFSPDGRTALTAGHDGAARLWPLPSPVPGEAERVSLWTQVLTGMELNAGGVRALSAPTWHERRRRLDALGGAPVP